MAIRTGIIYTFDEFPFHSELCPKFRQRTEQLQAEKEHRTGAAVYIIWGHMNTKRTDYNVHAFTVSSPDGMKHHTHIVWTV